MNITLDHNCIIDLANRTEVGALIQTIVASNSNQCFIVNIGASEMRERGVRPDRYDKFEELLAEAGVSHLPRLNPMLIFDVTFWDKCVWADDRMIQISQQIDSVLFGQSTPVDIPVEDLDSTVGKKWLNRLCDVHSMWCHIHNGNDVFLTSDGNFMKTTKLPQLLALGAGRVCSPKEL